MLGRLIKSSVWLLASVFQNLIGMLGRAAAWKLERKFPGFQNLIGMLGSHLSIHAGKTIIKFQNLIGMLEGIC